MRRNHDNVVAKLNMAIPVGDNHFAVSNDTSDQAIFFYRQFFQGFIVEFFLTLRHEFHRLYFAADKTVQGQYVTAAAVCERTNVTDDTVGYDFLRGNVVLNAELGKHIVQIVALDLRNRFFHLHFVGKHGYDHVFFVDIGKGNESVHRFDAFFQKQVVTHTVSIYDGRFG